MHMQKVSYSTGFFIDNDYNQNTILTIDPITTILTLCCNDIADPTLKPHNGRTTTTTTKSHTIGPKVLLNATRIVANRVSA